MLRAFAISTLFVCLTFHLQATQYIVSNTNDAGVGSLRSAIDSASAFDTVRLDQSLLNAGSDTIHILSQITIDVAITIIGAFSATDSIVVSGDDSVSIFRINIVPPNVANVILDSIYLVRGAASSSSEVGGAIEIVRVDTLRIRNSVLRDHFSSELGAAIGGDLFGGDTPIQLYLDHVDFRNNEASTDGGAIFIRVTNVWPNVADVLNVGVQANDCRFLNNTAGLDGGGICIITLSNLNGDSSIVNVGLSNSVLSSNDASNGGCLYLKNAYERSVVDLTIEDVVMDSNSGGAVHLDNSFGTISDSSLLNLSITGGHFQGNSVLGQGGVVKADGYVGHVVVDSSHFEGNSSNFHGGVLDLNFQHSSSVDVSASTFTANSADNKGGALRTTGVTTEHSFVNCDFSNNYAGSTGGGIEAQGTVTISGCTIHHNEADSNGGGVIADSLSLFASELSYNTSGASGGGFWANKVLIDSCMIFRDSADKDGGGGHVNYDLYVQGASVLKHNHAGRDGGAISLRAHYPTLLDTVISNVHIIDQVTIDSNRAEGSGGGVSAHHVYDGFQDVEEIHAVVEHVQFNGNQAGASGGALNIRPTGLGHVLVNQVDFIGNECTNKGGAIHMAWSNSGSGDSTFLQIDSSQFMSNVSSDYGGAVYSESLFTFNTLFESNQSAVAGAVYLNDSLYAEHSTFEENTADGSSGFGGSAGGIQADEIELRHVLVRNNFATHSGGGIVGVYVRIDSVDVLSNVADSGSGGGIVTVLLVAKDSRIDSNSAGEDGGGVYGDKMRIDRCSVNHNSAGEDGGGIHIDYNNYTTPFAIMLEMDSSSLVSNDAGGSGGGVYGYNNEQDIGNRTLALLNMRFNECAISSNHSDSLGGGVYGRTLFTVADQSEDTTRAEVNIHFVRSTLSHNTAVKGGGAVYVKAMAVDGATWNHNVLKTYVRFHTSTVTENDAGNGGVLLAKTTDLYYSQSNGASINSRAYIDVYNSTIYRNHADTIGGILCRTDNAWPPGDLRFRSSILAGSDSSDLFYQNAPLSLDEIISEGFNIFGQDPRGSNDQDQINIDSSLLNLGPLAANGGFAETLLPGAQSLALNNGDTSDVSDAQNGAIFLVRDIGAAESAECEQYTQFVRASCGEYYWKEANLTLDSSGFYVDSSFNSQGCQVVHELSLTVSQSHASFDTVNVCGSYTWPVTGITYSESGSYFDSSTTTAGCDSVYLLELTVDPIYSFSSTLTACSSYTWPVNGMTYTASGQYQANYSTVEGCDSNYVLHLTVISIDTAVTVSSDHLNAQESNAGYVWLDCDAGMSPIPNSNAQSYYPDSSGNFAVAIFVPGCTDTSACHFIEILPDTTVGTEPKWSDAIDVYPNPTQEMIYLAGLPLGVSVLIYNALGQTVYAGMSTHKNQTLPIEGAPGVYFIEVDGTQVFRVVKQ